MQPLTQYILAAVLFVLGLAAIGGATFGSKRSSRLILAAAGIVLWALTLVLYSGAASQSTEEVATSGPAATVVSETAAPTAAPASTPVDVVAPAEAPAPIPAFPGRIAFHSERTGDLEIWLMDGSAENLRQLTDSPGRNVEPAWSPDGQLIAFASGRDDADNLQIYLMQADGSDQRRLMEFIAADQLGPRWSPDGEWIAFFSNADGLFQVYKARKDGTELTQLTSHDSNNFMPDWSPDGSRIVFVSERDGSRQLYVMNADGSNSVRLTSSMFDDIRPHWSPDGATIVFESDRDGLPNLYAMAAPSTVVTQPIDQDVRLLTFPGFSSAAPAWALAGEAILFSSDRDAVNGVNWEVYSMNADGSNVIRLTNSDKLDRFADWTP